MPINATIHSPVRSPVRSPVESEWGSTVAAQILDNLAYEPAGAMFYFKQSTAPVALIRDSTTVANRFEGNANNKLVYTSPSTKYVRDINGTYSAGTTLRCDHINGAPVGLLVEVARTNLALRSNDFTNASWTKTNMTTALNATGPDGTANGASTLTATAGNATALQSITDASAARISSCFIRRVTGSGTINVTQDNGTTWTAVTVTSSWTRVQIPSATLANPVVGIRIVTSGDAVEVWCFQHEVGAYVSSPIVTAGSTVARAADDISLPVAQFPSMASGGYMTVRWVPTHTTATNGVLSLVQDNLNRTVLLQISTGPAKRAHNVLAGVANPNMVPTGAPAAGTPTTATFMFATSNFKAASDGGAIQTSTAAVSLPTFAHLSFGNQGREADYPSAQFGGYIQWAKVVPRTNLTDAQVVTESALAL